MERKEFVVRVMLKPNCGLENTRAALVVRRIMPLCDTVSCHPRTVKSDRDTISYLRDHGLYIRFESSMPEQVLLAIKGSFFVDRCAFVQDAGAIPPYDASSGSTHEEHSTPFALPSAFSHHDGRSSHDDELTNLLARFEKIHRDLRVYAERTGHDHELGGIVFSHAQAVDGLRTTVARSRIESFDRIVPSLRTLVDDYGQRFGVQADLVIADGNVALDRSVLASMEEIIKHAIRSCIRDDIERADERTAIGKPARATIRVRLENDGSDVVCRIEHDGALFDFQIIGRQAREQGMLTRPLETYTDDEIGAFLLLPGFATSSGGQTATTLSRFNEIGSMLQHVGGRGRARNTSRNTVELILHFPVPFTVIEAALVRAGNTHFALPAQQIKRFEAFRPERIEDNGDGSATKRRHASFARYVSEEGDSYELLNEPGAKSPFAAGDPEFALVLESLGQQRCLIVDAVDGYERISVNQLPALLDRKITRETGCIGYAILENGSPCIVVSVRRLLNAAAGKEESHA